MRDTIIGFIIFTSLIGGYFAFRTKLPSSSSVVTQSAVPANNASPVTASKPLALIEKSSVPKIQFKKIGEMHERTKSRRSRPHKGSRHHQRSARVDLETEKLPSIYQEQEGRVTESNAPESPKAVYGVPVEAWVLSRRDRIVTEPADPKLAEGMRIYLGCMELKNQGPRELTKRECLKLSHNTADIR